MKNLEPIHSSPVQIQLVLFWKQKQISFKIIKIQKTVSKLFSLFYIFHHDIFFNVLGAYTLHLDYAPDHVVAQQILRINFWDVEYSKARGKPDCSQKGNYQNLRNESLNRRSFHFGSDFILPNEGEFQFDYQTSVRCDPKVIHIYKTTSFCQNLISINFKICILYCKINLCARHRQFICQVGWVL